MTAESIERRKVMFRIVQGPSRIELFDALRFALSREHVFKVKFSLTKSGCKPQEFEATVKGLRYSPLCNPDDFDIELSFTGGVVDYFGHTFSAHRANGLYNSHKRNGHVNLAPTN